MLFNFDNGLRLVLMGEALNKVEACLANLGFSQESGGILLGSYDPNISEYRITDFTLPTSDDTRSAFSFIRNKNSANTEIEKAWQESDGTVNYLGEWHTHDEIMPHPSSIDRDLMRDVVADGSCVFDHCFMLIFGSGGGVFCAVIERDSDGRFADVKKGIWKQDKTDQRPLM